MQFINRSSIHTAFMLLCHRGIGGFFLKKVTLFFEFFQIIPYIIDAINLKTCVI